MAHPSTASVPTLYYSTWQRFPDWVVKFLVKLGENPDHLAKKKELVAPSGERRQRAWGEVGYLL